MSAAHPDEARWLKELDERLEGLRAELGEDRSRGPDVEHDHDPATTLAQEPGASRDDDPTQSVERPHDRETAEDRMAHEHESNEWTAFYSPHHDPPSLGIDL